MVSRSDSAVCACGNPKARPHHRTCRDCYLAERFDTPLRSWRRRSGNSLAWLARESGVSLRTVMRVARGEKASGPAALAIHRVTTIPVKVLLRGYP